jgi:serine/threonine protein kinase
MPLAPGTKLGPYEVAGLLGAGGMGEVYRAKDSRLGRDVAIKILPKEMSADPARKQRFEREAKTISSLNHPHICVLAVAGFAIDPKVLSKDAQPGHYGLRGMRERAKLMGGKLAVWSELDSGTELELSIPASRAYETSVRRRSWLVEKLAGKDPEAKS